MHLSLAVHRHPRSGHHPHRPEPGGLRLNAGTGLGPSAAEDPTGVASPRIVEAAATARNLTRGTTLATSVETADSLWGKFLGLMGRPSLAEGAALWLPESNGIHMMFMRFPIDAVFVGRPSLGAGGARPVVSVHRRLRTWTGLVPLVRGAHGVLELPVGTIEASGTQVGDLIELG